MSKKIALIIGNSEYEDGNLAKLKTPDTDVNALAEVLRDAEIGGFDEVSELVNQPSTVIRRAIASFFFGRGRDDLMLLYFSGHGIRDDRGQLFLAAKDTDHKLLRGTAIPAAYVTEEMDNSHSRRQVLILDCCHSGAFTQGMKAATGASVGTAAAFVGTGSGRVVLTATDSTQYAWEGDRVIGKADNSVFTHYLVKGLCTGEADLDANGEITLDELYNYVYEQVVNETPMQTPGKWSYGQRGEIVIAKNPSPVVKPLELPLDLQQTIEDPRPWVREGAVQELDRLVKSNNPGLALAAREALARLVEDDSRRVSSLASDILAANPVKDKEPPAMEVRKRIEAKEEQIRETVKPKQADKESQRLEKAMPVSMGGKQAELEQVKPEKSEESQKARDSKEATAQQHSKRGYQAIDLSRLIQNPLIFITVGWAIPWAIGWSYAEAHGWDGSNLSAMWLLMWLFRGLTEGLALRKELPSINWKHIISILLGWVVNSGLGVFFSIDPNYEGGLSVLGVVYWLIGSLVTGLVIKWAERSIRWTDVAIITSGWMIGMAISEFSGHPLYDAYNNSFGGPAIFYAIPGAIQGALAGIIGGSVMFWQLYQVQRRNLSTPAPGNL
jgi:hypothetical protein